MLSNQFFVIILLLSDFKIYINIVVNWFWIK